MRLPPAARTAGHLAVVLLLWSVLILPAALSPHLAYLDDPTTLLMARAASSDPAFLRPDGWTGRYFPALWLYFGLQYPFFGAEPAGYYLVQALLFLACLVVLYLLAARFGGSPSWGLFAALLCLTASPVAENLYTLSKAEPKVLFLLTAALCLFSPGTGQGRAGRGPLVRQAALGLLLFLAVLTKETAASFVAFGAAGAALARGRSPAGGGGSPARPWAGLFLISLAALLLARGLYYLLRPQGGPAAYTTYPLSPQLLVDNIRAYLLQQPDVLAAGLAGLVLLGAALRRGIGGEGFLFAAASFSFAAVYLGGLLFWRQAFGYYLLIPAVFFCLAAAVLGGLLWGSKRGLVMAAAVFLVATRLYSLPYMHYIASAQKAQDEVYAEAMAAYVRLAGPGERLVVESWPFYAEPVTQSNRLLELWGRKDLSVAGVEDLLTGGQVPAETLRLYGVAGVPDSAERAPRKGDYLLCLTGDRRGPWVLRGVSPFSNEGSRYEEQGLGLARVSQRRIAWQGLTVTPPFFRPGLAGYSTGYLLYRVEDPRPRVVWQGRWSDGWIGRRASVSLRGFGPRATFAGVLPARLAPARLEVRAGERMILAAALPREGPFHLTVPLPAAGRDGFVRLEFLLDKGFNPRAAGESDDDRELAVLLKVKED